MITAESLLSQMSLDEVSALKWKWTTKQRNKWVATIQIADDAGEQHVVDVWLTRIWADLTPERMVITLQALGRIPKRYVTTKPGPVFVGYEIDFYTDDALDKMKIGHDMTFARIAPRLMVTVGEIAKKFLAAHTPDFLVWSAVSSGLAAGLQSVGASQS